MGKKENGQIVSKRNGKYKKTIFPLIYACIQHIMSASQHSSAAQQQHSPARLKRRIIICPFSILYCKALLPCETGIRSSAPGWVGWWPLLRIHWLLLWIIASFSSCHSHYKRRGEIVADLHTLRWWWISVLWRALSIVCALRWRRRIVLTLTTVSFIGFHYQLKEKEKEETR